MTVAIAIRIRMRGKINANGTLNHFVKRWGNAPSVKNAAINAIRGRTKLNTRNQMGNVVIILFSIYVQRITENVAVVKGLFRLCGIFIIRATIL